MPGRSVAPSFHWIIAWLGGPLIGIANGATRDLLYEKRLGDQAAHQLSTVSAIALFGAYFDQLERRWPLPSRASALYVGAVWLALTIAFEFAFGRFVGHKSFREMSADYNLAKGRTWPLVLLWLLAGPLLISERRRA